MNFFKVMFLTVIGLTCHIVTAGIFEEMWHEIEGITKIVEPPSRQGSAQDETKADIQHLKNELDEAKIKLTSLEANYKKAQAAGSQVDMMVLKREAAEEKAKIGRLGYGLRNLYKLQD